MQTWINSLDINVFLQYSYLMTVKQVILKQLFQLVSKSWENAASTQMCMKERKLLHTALAWYKCLVIPPSTTSSALCSIWRLASETQPFSGLFNCDLKTRSSLFFRICLNDGGFCGFLVKDEDSGSFGVHQSFICSDLDSAAADTDTTTPPSAVDTPAAPPDLIQCSPTFQGELKVRMKLSYMCYYYVLV